MFDQYLYQLDVVDMCVDADLLDSAFQSEENLKSVKVAYPEMEINGISFDGSYHDPAIRNLNPIAQDKIVDLYCELWARNIDGHVKFSTMTIENPYH
jgi:hypothetical protein